MRSGVLWYYGGATLRTYDNAVPPRMAEISGKNVCPGGCGCGCGCVHCLTDLLGVVRIWFGIVSLIVECLYGLGGYGPSSYRTSMPPDVYTHASPAPDLFDPPKTRRPASTCDCTTPTLVRFRCTLRAALLPSTDVWWPRGPTAHARGALCGVAPASKRLDRPHPSGGGDGISRPCGFGTPGNARIASGRRRIVRVRIRGGAASFFPNDHSQTTTVGAACIRVNFWARPWGGGGCGRTTAAVVVRGMAGRVILLAFCLFVCRLSILYTI